ncbi:carboxylate/amino acid/amine transporter [Salinivirga cyanobacteriivorans]|uniref:Carboxylate/amino acid/amine transporter n=1 Tax=Salinivirga cyanobacteriivorans TaxID=1307839 RepID=A0A0S2HXR5_9BACT|nr:DMT family transporter [Salinivirga cyanobacteriivorans]ALO14842.1 carboxylate/amino acid/amine transporter [Salinivirga cyanobacteriivorans]
MENYYGEIAGIGTAVCWTATSMFFEAAGKRIGSLSVNLIRLFMAFFLLGTVTWITRGYFLPLDATSYNLTWLALSGLIGFTIGDLLLFQAFVVVGARISMLIMALAPPVAAIAGWIILGEAMTTKGLLGMMITLTGIMMVVLNRPAKEQNGKKPKLRDWFENPLGLLLAFGGAAGQAVGLVLSKKGMENYDVIASTHIRVMAGAIGFMIVFTFMRRWRRVFSALKDKKGMLFTSGGAFFGPFLGVTLSLVAVKFTSAGIAQTLTSLVPVIIILPSVFIFKERVTPREVLGAFVAVAGVAMFFI